MQGYIFRKSKHASFMIVFMSTLSLSDYFYLCRKVVFSEKHVWICSKIYPFITYRNNTKMNLGKYLMAYKPVIHANINIVYHNFAQS